MPELGRYARELRARLWKPPVDDEVRDEIHAHLEQLEQDLVARGLSRRAARAAARERFGDVSRITARCRDEAERRDRGRRAATWLAELRHDARFALRRLRASPRFALVAVLTLALGIGGTTAVFSAVDAVLLEPLPYAQPGQLVRLYQTNDRDPGERQFVTPVHFLAYRARLASLDGVAAVLTYDAAGADVGSGEGARRIRLMPVSADYFDVLRVRPAVGRPFTRDEETGARVVILGDALWRRLGGDRAAVGSPLRLNGATYTVVGVMPPGFGDPLTPGVDAWVPFDLRPGRDASNANNHYLSVVARLRGTTTLASAQAELDRVGAQLAREYADASHAGARLDPLKEDITASSSRALTVMLGAVVLVLVLVCVNVANLLLVRGTERAREFALRTALGAGRGRLVRQMLVESLVLALAGALAGLATARAAMAAIVRLGAGSIPRLETVALEPRLVAFALALATACAVGFGLVPALRTTRARPSETLRGEGRATTGGVGTLRLRDGLVVSQVALAFVLLVGAGLLVESVRRMREVDLGVRPDGVLAYELHLPDTRYDSTARALFYERVARVTEALPDVVAAGGVSRLPATGPYNQWGVDALTGPLAGARVEGFPEERVVSGDYFRAIGIPLLEGRLLDARDDARAPHRVVVSRAFARRYFPGMSALGQRIRTGGRDCEIVGVVGDVAIDAEGTPDTYVYHAHAQFAGDRDWALTQVTRTTGAVATLVPAVRRTVAALDPQLVVHDPVPLGDAIGRGEARRAFTVRLLATFALVALALAALGLFGVLSYGVRLREREFGIRIALGAERGAVRWMVLRRGLALVIAGTVIGLGGAAGATRLMRTLVFQVRPLEPAVLAGAAAFLLAAATLAAYLPAFRATRVDPTTTLK
ncbi:permease (plasmid) [Gemmatirosa kalamazoonensis]|uniref:Permease n=1 Tax=Gemmatirosa kalamazoonensis TaxID=861299 RepID=W0RQW2_9BACT|nr:ABC transporter permease [Gemmatirosa kalamazoonensis]AHG93101.1 permease [Gemmatirosa kalamazoonensis]